MKIVNSTVVMASQHDLVEKDVEQQMVHVWDNTNPTAAKEANGLEDVLKQAKQDVVEISAKAKELFAEKVQSSQGLSKDQSTIQLSKGDEQKIRLVQLLIEALTGKKIKFSLPITEKAQETPPAEMKNYKLFSSPARNLVNSQAPLLGWGMEYHSYKAHSEQECTSFQAAGIVKTADGKEIDFSAQVNMSRQFLSEQRVDVKAGDALRDPLVINFDGGATQLTNNKFYFDIDSNGTQEKMSFVSSGSGFLALDLNHDGVVNNGKELFGPDSGDGFADLAKYDSDGNQWIDENDPIYQDLRIWTKDADGKDQLFALGQKGIGAIYLGNVSTEFSVKDNTNQLQGQIRQTGIFLKENGQVGTIQHVDLAI
ncbi:hypothetical protein [Pelosinus sp. sgz500959]|uniref:hypothetical protein n=1 Tax=Pelosinus sp. sgz500959 TaxID=3242472 RepID=UPI0036719A9B